MTYKELYDNIIFLCADIDIYLIEQWEKNGRKHTECELKLDDAAMALKAAAYEYKQQLSNTK